MTGDLRIGAVGSRASVREFLEYTHAVHVLHLDLEGTIRWANGAVAENLGLSSEQLVGESIERFLTEVDAKRLRAELPVAGRRARAFPLNFCGRAEVPYTLECWLDVEADGATLIAEPPLRRDRVHRQELLTLTEDLALLSRERSRMADMERLARAEAESANLEKDTAIATVVHELRQPLGPLRFAVELLARASAPADRDRVMQVVVRQVEQLSRLVDDLLDAARLRADKLTLQKARLDLDGLLQEIAEGVRARMERAGIAFESRMRGGPLWISGDRQRLTQVFQNILDNAVKYTPGGGSVTLEAGVEQGMVAVSIRDSGHGISPEALPRIFTMFGQQRGGERGGLGIGLAVTRGIAVLHGGSVEAESAGIGQGATFTVRLPLDRGGDPGEPTPA